LIDAVSLVITLTGIFFLRNKLAEAESDEPESDLTPNLKHQELGVHKVTKTNKILQTLKAAV
ncbi:hypothetical protein AAA799P11_01519, partial [Marine Group I thaumarchaeote SCGC AAA799-P11]